MIDSPEAIAQLLINFLPMVTDNEANLKKTYIALRIAARNKDTRNRLKLLAKLIEEVCENAEREAQKTS